MSDINDLKIQIEATIKELNLKQQSSSEPVVDGYTKKYNDVLSLISAGEPKDVVIKHAQGLLSLARGYMEASSNYQQSFLNEMSKTEKLIKQM